MIDASLAPTPAGSDVLLFEDLSQQHLPARTLVAVLQRAGQRVQLVHFGQDVSTVIALAQRAQPRLIVFSILFADRVPECLALITALRQSGVRAHVTMAGPLPTFACAELLAACPALDSVLCGEAEATVAQLAAAFCHSERSEESLPHRIETPSPCSGQALRSAQGDSGTARWQTVPGLAYCSPVLRVNPAPKPLASLDDMPFPLHDDVPEYTGYGFATVEASRGCYHACAFCLPCAFYRATGAPYRLRSIPHLVDEIEALYLRGTRLFLFDDEQFLPPGHARGERVEALGRELALRGLDVAFTVKCRADDVDVALFRRLKEMGLLRVYVGVESGCQETLDLLGKGVTAQRNAEALAILDELGIVADFRSLMFHPWSTLETIQADLAFLQSVMPHVPTCFSFREVEVYPGTPLAARLEAEGRGGGDPWPIPYTIADPCAELVRRLNRIVFSPSGAHARTQDAVTQAWYDVLLRRRFEPARLALDRARKQRGIAAQVNSAALEVWREMLAFAREGDIYNAGLVNELAGAWAGRINSFCHNLPESRELGRLEGMQT